MRAQRIGILHPGEMGISLAFSAQETGHTVYWVSSGRSEQTRARAKKYALQDAGTLERLCETCSVIVSVCPPHAAEEVAIQVCDCAYAGVYLDANAISPKRARRIADRIHHAGATFVDGGIIGGPAWERGGTRLYLSGADAKSAAACFSAGPLDTILLDDTIGRASALKMCYAANSKGTAALLCAILAAADKLQIREALEDVWSTDDPEYAENVKSRARRVTRKAWRFSGEMNEIAETFEDVGLPGGFHRAGSDIYQRIAHFKGKVDLPGLDSVLDALNRPVDGDQTSAANHENGEAG